MSEGWSGGALSRRALLAALAPVSCLSPLKHGILPELARFTAEKGLGLIEVGHPESRFYPFGPAGINLLGVVKLQTAGLGIKRMAKDGRSYTGFWYRTISGPMWIRFGMNGDPLEKYPRATAAGSHIEFAADNERAVFEDSRPFDEEYPLGGGPTPSRIWAGNARTGEFVKISEEVRTGPSDVAETSWGPGNEHFVASVGEEVRLYTYGTWKYRVVAKGCEPRWSPDGRWLVYLGPDGFLKLREMRGVEPSREWNLIIRAPGGGQWSPDSRYFLYATDAFDLRKGLMSKYALAVFRTTDLKRAAVGHHLWDLQTNKRYAWAYLSEKQRQNMPLRGRGR